LPFCIALAVRDMVMTIDEAIAAVTTGGAAAVRDEPTSASSLREVRRT